MPSKNTTYLIGLVAAAAAGAALGMLLAPKKGSEMRKDIQHRIDGLSDQVKRLTGKVKSQANNIREEFVTGS